MDPVIDQTFSVINIVNLFIGIAIFIAVLLSFYYMFTGAISLILSGGQDEKIKEAVNTIRYSVIGLVMTILAIASIFLLGNIFGVDVGEYISFDRVSEMLSAAFDRILYGKSPDAEF